MLLLLGPFIVSFAPRPVEMMALSVSQSLTPAGPHGRFADMGDSIPNPIAIQAAVGLHVPYG